MQVHPLLLFMTKPRLSETSQKSISGRIFQFKPYDNQKK